VNLEKDLKSKSLESGSEVEDSQVETALKNFRQSVRGWSEQEFGRPRVPARRGAAWWLVRHAGAAWALAVVMAVTGVSFPVATYFRNQHSLMEAKKAADAAERANQERLAELQREAATIDDEALLKEVDGDIAQETPDAMEPLASLMTESAAK